ncbi:hypothetical protein VCR6J2_380024 [Vibrio coralliirubri]|nr:hypothetical protein VCR6J2_380024 [Vibrio coralliirubri]
MRPENMLIAKTSWNSRSKLDKERKREREKERKRESESLPNT